MRKFAFILALPLAACSTVEERTDARSGTGFSSTTIDGASGPQASRQQVTMQGLEPVPVVTLSGVGGGKDAAAKAALEAGGADAGSWTTVSVSGETYALRQVDAGGTSFAVADPQGGGGMSQGLMTQTAVRTGCLTTGETWEAKGRFAMALDCS